MVVISSARDVHTHYGAIMVQSANGTGRSGATAYRDTQPARQEDLSWPVYSGDGRLEPPIRSAEPPAAADRGTAAVCGSVAPYLRMQRSMVKLNHIKILHQIHARVNGTQMNCVITGSLGFTLQGLDVDVHDIDLQTDSTGAYESARLLAEHVSKLVLSYLLIEDVLASVCWRSRESQRRSWGISRSGAQMVAGKIPLTLSA
jgi:hypothetical protein